MVNWTKEQHEAIYADGSDILVAAAAGSGKTAVLVERIIQKLMKQNDPVDIDSLLVVTFTNAAAQEMRSRVGLALEKALAEKPDSNHLKKQLSLLQRASISTLHSFCLDVVKQYAYLLDIDPGFRIANDMEGDLIKQEVLDDLFEEWYGKEDDSQTDFFAVVDRFSSDRSDADVENVILDLYQFAIQNPYPDEWLDSLSELYHVPENWKEDEVSWLQLIKRDIKGQFIAMEDEIKHCMDITKENDGPYQYAEIIAEDMQGLYAALEKLNHWDTLQTYMQEYKFKALPRKKTECNEEKKEYVKQVRKTYKDRWDKMKKDLFSRSLDSHLADMRELAPVISQLTELVKQFKKNYTKQKQEKAIVDFSDLEHYCLALLMDGKTDDHQPIPSSVAVHLQKQFTEVLVDEYQDTNLVQETIVRMMREETGAGNMFMVGDVKQSIYRFRHAEPSLFIDKYKRFAEPDNAAKRIDLASNFRSREQVLNGTNYIFRQILDEELGEINYDRDAELIYANHMYDNFKMADADPELLIIDTEQSEDNSKEPNAENQADENYLDLEKAQLEARAYAGRIKEWIGKKTGSQMQVVDKETGMQRDIQYRDIVILLRSMTWAPAITDELKKQGIPVYAELSTGYFESIEVKVMLCFLKIIDNPKQDIPLASVLRSPIVGLNEEEMAEIRLTDRKSTYYDALKQYNKQHTGKTAEKVQEFLDKLKSFRLASRHGALSELIWEIYRVTGYYDFVGGMPGGRQRQANLRALYDRARGYETTSFRGLFRFLRFIERMEERGDDLGAARALSEQEDVVRIMTIHKSKGLEFPVVILGAMNKQFNLQDLRQRYLLHKDLGLAMKYIDPIKRITYPTLLYHAFAQEKLHELLAEEMRVLYVALTRAKEKLLMVASMPSFAKQREKWQRTAEHPEWVIPAYFRIQSKTYLDWVGPALIRHQANDILREGNISETVPEHITKDVSTWKVTCVHGSVYANLNETNELMDEKVKDNIVNWVPLALTDELLKEMTESRLSYRYPYEKAKTARAKQTVTELKRQYEMKDEYSSNQLVQPFPAPIVKRPRFMQKEKNITAAERGTAMHTVMQHIPLGGRTYDSAWIQEFAESLVMKEIITNDEADSIDIQAIAGFFATDLGKQLIHAEGVYREVPFSLALPAGKVYSNWDGSKEEQVLVQGVIDCLIPYKDGWIIIDYKSDAIHGELNEKVQDKLKQRYKIQIELYRYAISEIWHQPVYASHLYFFSRQLIVTFK